MLFSAALVLAALQFLVGQSPGESSRAVTSNEESGGLFCRTKVSRNPVIQSAEANCSLPCREV